MIISKLNPFLTILFLGLFCREANSREILDRRELLTLLRQSPKWSQTQAPQNEAHAKLLQAQSAERLHAGFFARQIALKTNPISLGLNNDQTIDTIGFGSTGIAAEISLYSRAHQSMRTAAEWNEKAGISSTRMYQNDLTFLSFSKYLQVTQAKSKIDASEISIRKDRELLDLARAKLKVGAGIPLDVARVEALVEKDQLKKLEAESQYRQSMTELEDLIGALPVGQRLESLRPVFVSEKELRRLAQKSESRPELEMTHRNLEAVRELVHMAESEVWPELTVFGEVSTVGTQALGLVNSPTGALGLQIKIPLSDGGYMQGRKSEALNKVYFLEAQASLLKDSQTRQIELAISQITASEKAVKTAEKAFELAQKEMEFAFKKVRIGSGGSLDLINAQSSLAQATDLKIQADWTYEMAKIKFFHLIADVESYLSRLDLGDSYE